MSFQPKVTPTADTKLANINNDRVATNQETVPVPYLAGSYPMRMTWISNALRVTIKDVQAQTGKKTSSTVARDYYADIAGALCHGTLDYIKMIILDSNVVWTGALTRDSSGTGSIYKEVTVEGYGVLRIYWGTADQTPDPTLNAAVVNPDYERTYDEGTGVFGDNGEPPTIAAFAHPAYRFIAYGVWQQLYFGRDRTSTPQCEIIGGRVPAEYETGETDEGVNPMSIQYELITSKMYGLGLDPAIIDATSWAATRDAINPANVANATKPSYHISVYITKQQAIRSLFADITSYYDGYIRISDGLLEAGYFPHTPPATESGLLILDPSDFVDEPDIQSVGWDETYNIFQLAHVDRDRYYKEASTPYIAKHNIVITRENRPTNITKNWITTNTNAAKWIADYGRLESFPSLKGTIYCRKIKTVGLKEGDLFRLNYSPHAINQLCRALTVTEAEPGSLAKAVDFVSERGVMPDAYAPAADDIPPPPRLPATPISFAKVVELPIAFFESVYTYVGIIPVRPTLATLGWRGYYTLDDPGLGTPDYDEIANHLFFGALARLDANYSGSGEADMTVTVEGVDSYLLATITAKQQDDDTLLLFLDDEIFSIGTVTPVGGGQFTVSVKRARRGSTAAAHSQYALCYIIERAKLKTVTNENFIESTPGWFKIISYTGREQAVGGPVIELNFRDREGTPPAIVIGTLPSSPVTGAPYDLTATITDVDGDLSKYQFTVAKIVSSVVDSEITLLAGDIGPDQSGSSLAIKVPYMFPSIGTWQIIVRAYDAKGGFTKVSSSNMTVSLGDFLVDDGITPNPTSGETVTAGLGMLVLEWDNPSNTPISSVLIYEAATSSQPTDPSFVVPVNPLESHSAFFRQNLTASTLRYYWLKVQGLNGRFSSVRGPFSGTTRAGINLSDIIPGMTMVEIVGALPSSGNFTGRTVVLTTDGKLYRYDGSAFTAVVPATDISGTLADSQLAAIAAAKITGTLTNSQIADLAATKITGTLTDSQIAALAAAKLTGQIVSTQITDGAIVTAKLSAGAVTANELAASSVIAGKIAAGIITATELAAGAVITSKIAAGAVTAGEIAAGTITSTQLASGSVTAGKIAAGTITATELAAGAVTAGKIAAGSITSTEIAADAITAGKIAAGAITATAIGTNEIIAYTANIADAIITGAKIAAATIGSANIQDAAITSAKIGDAQIITAKIADLQVDTIKIADNAVTIPVSAYTSGSISTFNSGPYYMDIQSVTITSLGQPISILSSCVFASLDNFTFTFYINRNGGTDIWSADYKAVIGSNIFCNAFSDTPGAGTYTYYLRVSWSSSFFQATPFTKRFMEVKETLK